VNRLLPPTKGQKLVLDDELKGFGVCGY
jgi:hypothetical protein